MPGKNCCPRWPLGLVGSRHSVSCVNACPITQTCHVGIRRVILRQVQVAYSSIVPRCCLDVVDALMPESDEGKAFKGWKEIAKGPENRPNKIQGSHGMKIMKYSTIYTTLDHIIIQAYTCECLCGLFTFRPLHSGGTRLSTGLSHGS